jgi:hypothetical protein
MKAAKFAVLLLVLGAVTLAAVGVHHFFLTPEARLRSALDEIGRDEGAPARIVQVINNCGDSARQQKLIDYALSDPRQSLVGMLGDGNSDVRKAAAEALGKFGAFAVEPLIKRRWMPTSSA